MRPGASQNVCPPGAATRLGEFTGNLGSESVRQIDGPFKGIPQSAESDRHTRPHIVDIQAQYVHKADEMKYSMRKVFKFDETKAPSHWWMKGDHIRL